MNLVPRSSFVICSVIGIAGLCSVWASAGTALEHNAPDRFAQEPPDGSFIVFDVPAALHTSPLSINPAGVIAGTYGDSNGGLRGFIRARDGSITTFDAPGAGTLLYQGTVPRGINPEGVIAGHYITFDSRYHGFVRTPDGTITSFDVPGAVSIFVTGINPSGVIAGGYRDSNPQRLHGFVRTPDGTITAFDVPGAVWTFPSGINPEGEITGYWQRTFNGTPLLGFIRTADGTVTGFDPPGCSLTNTVTPSINPAGVITGSCIRGNPSGFVRTTDGAITLFNPPNSVQTYPQSINPAGMIAGVYVDGVNPYALFVRSQRGIFITFSIPDMAPGTMPGVNGINPSGVLTGSYRDSNPGRYHGLEGHGDHGDAGDDDHDGGNELSTLPKFVPRLSDKSVE